MAEAPDYPLVHHFGDSFDGMSVEWQDSAGVPKDITGYLASMKIKSTAGVELLHLDSNLQGGLQVDGPNGKVTINATVAQMAAGTLTVGNHKYDLQVKSGDGTIIKTLIKGDFRVDAEQTDV